MINVVPVILGGYIRPGSEPNACACKLTGNDSFDVVVNAPMQIKSFQRFTFVPCSFRYAIAYLSKAIERSGEIFVELDNYLQGSLSKHCIGDTTMNINTLRINGGE
jgi:hypothetical protein